MARIEKINDEIRSALSSLLSSVKDPRVRGVVTIVKADTTPDLKQSKIYVSVLDESTADEVLTGLKSASGFLRSGLGRALNLRNTPELIFIRDDSIKHGAYILDLLNSVQSSPEKSSQDQRKESTHEKDDNSPSEKPN
ncbi:MAG: 30S ribosome-binding factor RbfA [Clostridiales bacterium]|jgi:ribosome-binding factor A|nr:30S ribosome-binding factor RbfA [Clostridiales bacterium]